MAEGHIGIYIGYGRGHPCIGFTVGVIKTPIGDSGWTHWLKIPYITYAEETEEQLNEIPWFYYPQAHPTPVSNGTTEKVVRTFSATDIASRSTTAMTISTPISLMTSSSPKVMRSRTAPTVSWSEGIAKIRGHHYMILVEEQPYYFAKRQSG